ncbi:unnamed protein product [Cylicocyclus nassatus]|uniref:Replication stress response regulator SDE2 n=1 Tax=Cylicocyclus nassatus TaxID=53992 RepID=A0AA36DN43_CYLNA|nr:unnamed protein product [Cylicocyclus nassatus]
MTRIRSCVYIPKSMPCAATVRLCPTLLPLRAVLQCELWSRRHLLMVAYASAVLSKRSSFVIGENSVVDAVLALDPSTYFCTINGQIINNFDQVCRELPSDTPFQLHFRLLGGKGGFGSLLRSFRVNKSTNQLMCRDLNGRRLASIDEEQKLKKWIERAAEREKEKIAKRNAKYEKLKSGPPKHMFNDPDYIRQKETIIEKTEEAFEQGFVEFLKEEQEKKNKPVVESSSDSDFDIDDLPGGLKSGRKRKAAKPAPVISEKLAKLEEDDDSDSDSEENDVDPELLNEIREYFSARDSKLGSADANQPCSSKRYSGDIQISETNGEVPPKEVETPAGDSAKVDSKGSPPSGTPPAPQHSGSAEISTSKQSEEENATDRNETTAEKPEDADLKVLNKEEQEEEFAEIDLTKYASASELEALGLQHLKHALRARGMKCGGTLTERAVRLFSAKDMVTVKRLNKKKNLSNKKKIHTITTAPVSKTKKEESDEKKLEGEGSTSVPIEDVAKKIQETKDQGRVALTALRKHLANHSGKSLFPDIDHAVGILIVYKVPPLTTNKARLRIELSHSPRTTSNTSICLIMPDLDQSATARKDPDVEKQARQWAEKIEKDHGLLSQHYSKIMTKRQLERECHSYTQRRALATSYDLFLVDVRVAKAVRTFLGKDFYKVHKEPIDFDYSKPLVTSIEKAVKTVLLRLPRYATRAHVSFGHLGQDSADLAGNLDEVIDAVVSNCPGGLSNIRSLHMQPVGGTPSLPIYVDNGRSSDVKLERPRKRRRATEQVSDECSTLPDGLRLAIRRNGKVRVIKEDSNVAVHYPTIHDEWEERDGLKPTIDPGKLKRKHAIKKKRMQKRMAQKKIKSGERVALQQEAETKME